jgi:hypothetical protein
VIVHLITSIITLVISSKASNRNPVVLSVDLD